MPANTTTEAVADGNWVFLKPLSPGVHKIMFKGEVQQPKIKGRVVVPLHFLLDGILEQCMT